MNNLESIVIAAIVLLALFTAAFFFGPEVVRAFMKTWDEWTEIIEDAKVDE